MRKILLLFLLVFAQIIGYSQDIPQGAWRTHFSYFNAQAIETTSEKVFCAVENGLFYVDISDNTINILSKINGLSDVTVSALGYSNSSETLVIGYENGNIDLLTTEGIINIDLLLNQNLIQLRSIRDIHTLGETAFLSTDFGIVVIDLNRQVIDQVYREIGPSGVQPEIIATTTLGDSIFASTNLGLLKAALADNINLLDFNNWQLVDSPDNIDFTRLEASTEQIYLADTERIFTYQNGLFEEVNHSLINISRLRTTDDNTLLIVADGLSYQLTEGISELITPNNGLSGNTDITFFNNQFWIADQNEGLFSLSGNDLTGLSPAGPLSDQIQHIVFQENLIYAFGPFRDQNANAIEQPMFSIFENGNWSLNSIPSFSSVNDNSGRFFSSLENGLFDITENEIVDDAPLELNPISNAAIVTDIEESGNLLWVANPNTSNPLHSRDENGVWTSFNLNGRAPNIAQIAVSRNIWARNASGNGGVIILTPETAETEIITASNSDLPSSTINDLAIDFDDEVWVATDAGVAFIPSASNPISDFNNAILPIFENNFLFRDEIINSIEIDPGNRKWVGNQRGAWLLEEAGESLVVRFTAENSPLPSNSVLDISINPTNGEVFFVTDKGMVSFRSDATESTAIHADVKIFPNPVTPDFSGLVGISGLATDVRLKITDISGKLIRELEANGGTAAWNIRDHNGRKAKTGVYLFFSSDNEGAETFVGKIAIVN